MLCFSRLLSSRLVSSRLISFRFVSSRLGLACLLSSPLVLTCLVLSYLVLSCLVLGVHWPLITRTSPSRKKNRQEGADGCARPVGQHSSSPADNYSGRKAPSHKMQMVCFFSSSTANFRDCTVQPFYVIDLYRKNGRRLPSLFV